jgi:putative FmdB family regulatory protein
MPNYDFKCNTCNTVTELQDIALPPCPTCGETMVRVWSSIAVKFNAPGFYSTGG